MKDYNVKGNYFEVTLDNDKQVKVDKKYIDNMVVNLEVEEEEAILTWLEEEGYLENEDLEELDSQAKGQVKNVVKSEKPKQKTAKERTQKPQPEKEYIIGIIAEFLEDITGISNLNIENKTKIITFKYKNADYKIDLTQKRKEKKGE